MTRPFLTARWCDLAILNFDVAPELLGPYLPARTELDTFGGRTLISIVGFRFLDTRVLGLPVLFHRQFDEVNLRFYVRREGPDGPRRGVAFIREFVPRRLIGWTARALYDEPYLAVPMRHRISLPPAEIVESGRVRYEWRYGGRWHALEAATIGSAAIPAAGSEAEFITVHHWGYTAHRDGSTSEYAVTHPPWSVRQASSASLDCDVRAVYGARFVEALEGPPRSAFVATGSAVSVYRGRKLP